MTHPCDCPNEYDARLYRCGGRCAKIREGGREPSCSDEDEGAAVGSKVPFPFGDISGELSLASAVDESRIVEIETFLRTPVNPLVGPPNPNLIPPGPVAKPRNPLIDAAEVGVAGVGILAAGLAFLGGDFEDARDLASGAFTIATTPHNAPDRFAGSSNRLLNRPGGSTVARPRPKPKPLSRPEKRSLKRGVLRAGKTVRRVGAAAIFGTR